MHMNIYIYIYIWPRPNKPSGTWRISKVPEHFVGERLFRIDLKAAYITGVYHFFINQYLHDFFNFRIYLKAAYIWAYIYHSKKHVFLFLFKGSV